MTPSGLYIVSLTNAHPIPVNAHDPRRAARCIAVSHLHCKIGKANDFVARERNYGRPMCGARCFSAGSNAALLPLV